MTQQKHGHFPIPILILTILSTFCLSIIIATSDSILDKVVLKSQWYEKDTKQSDNFRWEVDCQPRPNSQCPEYLYRAGMIYTRFKLEFTDSKYYKYPLRVQLGVNALIKAANYTYNPYEIWDTIDDRTMQQDNVMSVESPSALFSLITNSFDDRISKDATAGNTLNHHVIMPFFQTTATKTQNNPSDGSTTQSQTPTLRFPLGVSSLKWETQYYEDEGWEEQGMDKIPHFLSVAFPLSEQVYQDATLFPFNYKVTISVEVPNDENDLSRGFHIVSKVLDGEVIEQGNVEKSNTIVEESYIKPSEESYLSITPSDYTEDISSMDILQDDKFTLQTKDFAGTITEMKDESNYLIATNAKKLFLGATAFHLNKNATNSSGSHYIGLIQQQFGYMYRNNYWFNYITKNDVECQVQYFPTSRLPGGTKMCSEMGRCRDDRFVVDPQFEVVVSRLTSESITWEIFMKEETKKITHGDDHLDITTIPTKVTNPTALRRVVCESVNKTPYSSYLPTYYYDYRWGTNPYNCSSTGTAKDEGDHPFVPLDPEKMLEFNACTVPSTSSNQRHRIAEIFAKTFLPSYLRTMAYVKKIGDNEPLTPQPKQFALGNDDDDKPYPYHVDMEFYDNGVPLNDARYELAFSLTEYKNYYNYEGEWGKYSNTDDDEIILHVISVICIFLAIFLTPTLFCGVCVLFWRCRHKRKKEHVQQQLQERLAREAGELNLVTTNQSNAYQDYLNRAPESSNYGSISVEESSTQLKKSKKGQEIRESLL